MDKVFIGAGGFAREVAADVGYRPKMFVEDEFCDYNTTYPLSEFDSKKHKALIVVGDPTVRYKLFTILPKDTTYWKHISKHAIILDNNNSIGDGTIICAGVIITTNCFIGSHVHLNIQTTVGHDSVINNFVTTAPSVNISGNVVINDHVYLGTKAAVREKVNICSYVTLGLNCGVVKNINEPGVYTGTPANKLK
jgi:sugar O-acyltransferase (sialic acid O-acetyltransferase NeuD family)